MDFLDREGGGAEFARGFVIENVWDWLYSEFVLEIGLHGPGDAEVVVATLGEEKFVEFSKSHEKLVDMVDSEDGVAVVVPVYDDL